MTNTKAEPVQQLKITISWCPDCQSWTSGPTEYFRVTADYLDEGTRESDIAWNDRQASADGCWFDPEDYDNENLKADLVNPWQCNGCSEFYSDFGKAISCKCGN